MARLASATEVGTKLPGGLPPEMKTLSTTSFPKADNSIYEIRSLQIATEPKSYSQQIQQNAAAQRSNKSKENCFRR